jgi:hypothetical protein
MIATIGLTILSYASARWGDGALAQSSMRWGVVIGKIALVLGIIQIVAQGMVQWAAAKAAAIEAAKQAGIEAAQVTVSDIIKQLIFGAVKDVSLTSMAKSLVSPGLKIANILLDRHYRNNLEDIMDKLQKSDKELEEINAKIEAQNADPKMLYSLAQIPFNPIPGDQARYNIDRIYGGNWRNIGQEFIMGTSTKQYKY